MERILLLQSRPPIIADPTLQWAGGVVAGARMTAVLNPPNFRQYRLGDRQQLHTALGFLPQLRRDQGHLLYLAATGPFTLRGGSGTICQMRVQELQAARQGGRTGDIFDWNFLSSLLPQESRVLHSRCSTVAQCRCAAQCAVFKAVFQLY